MKCQNCGKNTASWHYRSDINGKVTEEHLCSECAEKRGGEDVFSEFDSIFDGFFSPMDSFFGSGRSLFGNFGSFMMPTLMMPRVRLVLHEKDGETEAEEKTEKETAAKEDPELSRRRRINALREQMKAAAEKEDYEQAAQLRDKLHELEKSA